MKHLFAYGTLMCEDIMHDVAGRRFVARPAMLHGYSRRRVKHEHYPALIDATNSKVSGVVYRDIPEAAWLRLDRFEGAMYTRRGVRVELDNGEIIEADTYVIHGDHVHYLDDSEWDFDRFLRDGKQAFISDYKGYDSI